MENTNASGDRRAGVAPVPHERRQAFLRDLLGEARVADTGAGVTQHPRRQVGEGLFQVHAHTRTLTAHPVNVSTAGCRRKRYRAPAAPLMNAAVSCFSALWADGRMYIMWPPS